MRSRSHQARSGHHGRALCLAALFSLAIHSPASAITFALVGDGTSESLTWLSSPACISYTEGTTWSIDGRILSQSQRGTLDWTGQDALKVVAWERREYTHYSLGPCSDSWVAIEGRQVPLLFEVQAEPGDPQPLQMDLHIAPTVVGTLDMRAGIAGNPGAITLRLQLTMTVRVNGQLVSADSLVQEQTIANGQTLLWSPALPKGAANSITVPGVEEGDLIEVRVWHYQRLLSSDFTAIFGSSPYGPGVALVIDAQPINVLDASSDGAPDPLAFGVGPSPSVGAARIRYALPEESKVRLAVYDVTGHRVATLIDGVEPAGRREIAWDGRGTRGDRVAPGVYLVELAAGPERRVRRLVLLGR